MKTEERAQVPVTVLTGFLGAGETTLLNRPLTRMLDECFLTDNELQRDLDIWAGASDHFPAWTTESLTEE